MRTYTLVIAFVAIAGTASAQQMSMSEKMQLREDCGPDIQRLCPGIKPGGGELMGCIKEKKDQLSKTCSDTMGKLMAARKQN
jgi:hypothetical protein